MDLGLDAFLTGVYCTVDEVYQPHVAAANPIRPRKTPEVSESDVLTVALLAPWHPARSERAGGRYAAKPWRPDVPRLLDQRAFNRRVRDLHGVLAALGPALAAQLAHRLQLRVPSTVLDRLPVPVMARCRGNRHRCFATDVGSGCGGSDQEWDDGGQLLALVPPHGLISGWPLGPAATEARWVAAALRRWRVDPQAPPPTLAELAAPLVGHDHPLRPRVGPTGPLGPAAGAGHAHDAPVWAALGFSGVKWQTHWQPASQVRVLTTAVDDAHLDVAERRAGTRAVNGARQVIETVGQWVCDRFGLKRPRARSDCGLLTRVAAKVAAFKLGVYLNHLYDRPASAFFDPFA